MQVFSDETVVHTTEGHMAWEIHASQTMCLFCGFIPVEGMREYVAIHGIDAKCILCNGALPSVERIDQ
jgi:hypothetical protein